MNRKAAPKRPEIDRQPVKSSAIPSIGYDSGSKTLQIEFQSGHVYEATGVTPEEHQAFVGAKSIGTHYHQHLRGRDWERIA